MITSSSLYTLSHNPMILNEKSYLPIGTSRSTEYGFGTGALYLIGDDIISPYLSSTGNVLSLDNSTNYSLKLIGDLETYFGIGPFYAEDLNKNNKNDIILFSPYHSNQGLTENGSVYIIYDDLFDSLITGSKEINVNDTASFSIRFDGAFSDDVLGEIGGVNHYPSFHDYNGDGSKDLIISSRYADHNSNDSGSFYINYSSYFESNHFPTGTILHLLDQSSYNHRYDGQTLNYELTDFMGLMGGDVNNDGIEDIIFPDGNRANLYIIYGGGRVINLNSSFSAVDMTNKSIDLTIVGQIIEKIVLISRNDKPIFSFTGDFTDNKDVDLINSEFDSDTLLGKSYIYNEDPVENITSDFTLYIPRITNSIAVKICPDVNSFINIVETCDNGYYLSDQDSNVEIQNIDGNEYWVISRINNAGGMNVFSTNAVDLFLDKDVDYAARHANEELTYTIEFSNNSENIASDFLITDQLPNDISAPISITTEITSLGNTIQCGYDSSTHQVMCSKEISSFASLEPETLYYLSNPQWGDNMLRIANQTDWTSIEETEITMPGYTIACGTGLAMDPTTGITWAILYFDTHPYQSPGFLATIDLDTKIATRISPGNLSQRIGSITFDDEGNLYGSTGPGGGQTLPNSLFLIGKSDGNLTKIMDLPVRDNGTAITYNWDDGYLYHASGNSRFLDKINLESFVIESSIELEPNPRNDPFGAMIYTGNDTFIADSWCEIWEFDLTGNSTYLGLIADDHCSKGFMYPRTISIFSGDLLPGESGKITIVSQILSSVSQDDQLTNSASINSYNFDTNTLNNSDTTSTVIGDYANVWIENQTEIFQPNKTDLIIRIKFGNNGNLNADNITIRSFLSNNDLSFEDFELKAFNVYSPELECSIQGKDIVCSPINNASFNPGDNGLLELVITPKNNINLEENIILNIQSVISTSSDEYFLNDNQIEYVLHFGQLPQTGNNSTNLFILGIIMMMISTFKKISNKYISRKKFLSYKKG